MSFRPRGSYRQPNDGVMFFVVIVVENPRAGGSPCPGVGLTQGAALTMGGRVRGGLDIGGFDHGARNLRGA